MKHNWIVLGACQKYENVDGTQSVLANQISEDIKQHRWEIFMETARKISTENN